MSKPDAPKRSRLMDALRPAPAEVPEAPEAHPIAAEAPPTNMAKRDGDEELQNLNFKVRKPFFRSFSIMARELDMKNNAFLVELLDFYTRANAERFGSLSPEMQRRFAELQEKASKG